MIPREYVERHLTDAGGSTFFGIPLEKLSRDELMACAIAGWKAEKAQIEESARQRKFLLSLCRT